MVDIINQALIIVTEYIIGVIVCFVLGISTLEFINRIAQPSKYTPDWDTYRIWVKVVLAVSLVLVLAVTVISIAWVMSGYIVG